MEFASKYNVPLRVLHAHIHGSGTLIKKEEKKMEGALISGIAFTKDEAEVMIKGVKDTPGVAAKILGPQYFSSNAGGIFYAFYHHLRFIFGKCYT